MGSARTKVSWTGVAASVLGALVAVLVVASGGCSTIPTAACGDEPVTAVCGRFAFECGTAVVCYSCGVAKRIDCGACADTQTCGGGGTPHQCWPPLVDGGGEGGAGAGDDGAAATGDDAAAASGDGAASGADAAFVFASDASDDGAADATGDDGATTTDATTSDATTDDAAPSDAAGDDGASAPSDASAGATDDAGFTVVLCPEDAVPPEDTGAPATSD